MIARRKLFGFLAASPVAVVAAIAKAKGPTEISVDRIEVGDFEIVQKGEVLNIQLKEKGGTTVSFALKPSKNTTRQLTWPEKS